MRILIVSQYFWPENFRVNDLALGLVERGHEITVLTGIPNYPEGRFFEGYGLFNKKQENYRRVKVIRVPLMPRGKGGGFRLALNYFSFALCASILGPLRCRGKFDIIFVFEVSPITVGTPAIVFKKLKNAPIFFWVLDLWPESVAAAGNLHSRFILKLILPIVRFIYEYSDRILVSSRAFIPSIVDKGISQEKVVYFPQWAESIFRPVSEKDNEYKELLPNGFLVMFAGNIGESQDFESILMASELTSNYNDIHWVILGGGRKEEWVRDQVIFRGIQKTFHLVGKFPLEAMPKFYATADVMLISLKKANIFSLTIPAKIQSYLACGKPILAMMDGEGSRIIEEANAGLTCPAETPQDLANNVIRMKKMRDLDIIKMGRNARKYYDRNFKRSFLLSKAEELFSSMQSNSCR